MTSNVTYFRYSPATARTRAISLPVQMFVRYLDVASTEFGLCVASESPQCRQLSRFLANRTEVVSLLLRTWGCTIVDVYFRTVSPLASRSKLGRDEIKWQELLLHFRSVQAKHEKARRQALGDDTSPMLGFPDDKVPDPMDKIGRGVPPGKPPMRRRVTGDVSIPPHIASQAAAIPNRNGALSPLNPRRTVGGLPGLMGPSSTAAPVPSNLNPAAALTHAQKQRRPMDLTRK